MENKEKSKGVKFALRNITTEQFALLEDVKIDDAKIKIETNLRFGANDKEKVIAAFANFSYESESKTFIVIEVGCHFLIENSAWKEMLDEESNSLNVPKGLMSHLSMITVGSARGVLHAKTENTFYNKYVLPTVNVVDMIKKDAVFNFTKEKE